jgi:phosphatidylglycerophosphatase C
VTGRLEGPNCKGAEKVNRLTLEIGPLDAVEIHAYGDSPSDRALLNLVAHPYYRSFDHATGLRRLLSAALALLRALW